MPPAPDATQSTPPPTDDVAGYRVVRRVGEGSFVCLAPGDRYVVLKPLDADCMVGGALHPSIRDRLGRVRELAHAGVANLHGVERDDAGRAWLVWEHADGETFDAFLAGDPSPRDVWVVARELILAVESLHARGIVHGAVHGRNAIVDRSRQVRLTHVSPLLYADPADDAAAVLDLLARAGDARPAHAELSRVASSAAGQPDPLKAARAVLAGLIGSREAAPAPAPARPDRSPRRRALAGAALLAAVGVAIAYGVRRHALPPPAAFADAPVPRR